jgi:hypothetical protein
MQVTVSRGHDARGCGAAVQGWDCRALTPRCRRTAYRPKAASRSLPILRHAAARCACQARPAVRECQRHEPEIGPRRNLLRGQRACRLALAATTHLRTTVGVGRCAGATAAIALGLLHSRKPLNSAFCRGGDATVSDQFGKYTCPPEVSGHEALSEQSTGQQCIPVATYRSFALSGVQCTRSRSWSPVRSILSLLRLVLVMAVPIAAVLVAIAAVVPP